MFALKLSLGTMLGAFAGVVLASWLAAPAIATYQGAGDLDFLADWISAAAVGAGGLFGAAAGVTATLMIATYRAERVRPRRARAA